MGSAAPFSTRLRDFAKAPHHMNTARVQFTAGEMEGQEGEQSEIASCAR